MADYNSSLPIRTETNGDAAVKIVDGTITSQQLGVDSNGRITIKAQDGAGNALASSTSTPSGTEQALIVRNIPSGTQAVSAVALPLPTGASTSALQTSGNASLTSLDAKAPALGQALSAASVPVVLTAAQITTLTPLSTVAATRSGNWSVRSQDGLGNLLTSAAAGATRPLDVAIRDAAGSLYGSVGNPLNVALAAAAGTPINNFLISAAIAAAASSNHDYTVTAARVLTLSQVEATCSGKAKIEIQIETGVATAVFNTIAVQFNSTATPNMSIRFANPRTVAAGVRVRTIRTNLDKAALDLYSTLIGLEV